MAKKISCYIIGLGPGHPEYLTQMAIRVLKKLDVAIYPFNESKNNRALAIANPYLSHLCQKIPMPLLTHKLIQKPSYSQFSKTIQSYLDQNQCVGILCLGDPMLYASASYLLEDLQKNQRLCQIIPGITSIGLSSSLTQKALLQQDEILSILTGNVAISILEQRIKQKDQIALLKPNKKKWPIIYDLLKKQNCLENSFCISTTQLEVHIQKLSQIDKNQCPNYFSTILILNRPS